MLLRRAIDRLAIKPRSFRAFLFALGCVAVAALARIFLSATLGADLQFPTFFPAVVLTTLLAGTAAGIASIFFSLFMWWWIIYPPAFAFVLPNAQAFMNVIVFAASSSILVWMGHSYRNLMSDIVRHDRRRQMLMDELEHRSRNSFQIIQTILHNSIQNPEDAEIAIGRVRALSLTNQLLTVSHGEPVLICELIENELRPHGHQGVSVAKCDIRVEGDVARCLAMILHELVTNAVKYGALRNKSGKLSICSEEHSSSLKMTWVETNEDPINIPKHSGFGSKLVIGMLRQIGGAIKPDFRLSGLVCEITVPNKTRAATSVALPASEK